MTNYVKATDFASKDTLPSGDAAKVVKGVEINTEFAAIQTAVNSKADLLSPQLSGTPLAPTASYGTNTTQIATTAFVQTALRAIYPIGSIYTNATDGTNPSSLLGFGTWTAFGAGRVMVGYNSSNTLFNAAEKTGGSYDAIVVEHTHTFSGTVSGTVASKTLSESHTHSFSDSFTGTTGTGGSHSHTFSGTTSSNGAHQHAVDYPLDCTSNRYAFGSTTVSGVSTDGFCDSSGSSTSIPLTQSAGDHTHTYSGTTSTYAAHSHSFSGSVSGTTGGTTVDMTHDHSWSGTIAGTNASTGSSGTNANIQPYITVYMWKRTA